MENNEFKKVRIKNRTCYYFSDIIKLEDFHLDNFSINEKSHEYVFIYNILYKTLIDPKPLRIRYDKTDWFIRLTLFGSEKYNAIYNRFKYLISQKSSVKYIFFEFAKIKVDSYDSLPIEKRMTLHNVIAHIRSVLNKDKNHHYYVIFLEKCSYQLAKKLIKIFCL